MHPEIGKAAGGSPVSEMFFALMEKNIVIWRYGIRNTVCGKVQGSSVTRISTLIESVRR